MALQVQESLSTDLADFSQLDFVQDDSTFLKDSYLAIRLEMNGCDFIPKFLVALLSILKGILHSG
jgi:hypothetical protein